MTPTTDRSLRGAGERAQPTAVRRRASPSYVFALFAALVSTVACNAPESDSGLPQVGPIRTAPRAALPLPLPDASTPSVDVADSLANTLARTASIVDAQVASITQSYDDSMGPRTHVTLGSVTVLAGAPVPATITIDYFGGATADGRIFDVDELPKFVEGSRFVVFLTNQPDWYFSPVVEDLAFRVEVVGGREALVDTAGSYLTGVGAHGWERSAFRVSDPAGRDLGPEHFRRPKLRPQTAAATRDAVDRTGLVRLLGASASANLIRGAWQSHPQANRWPLSNPRSVK